MMLKREPFIQHLSEAGFGRKNDFKISMSKQVIKENFHYCIMQLRLAKWK